MLLLISVSSVFMESVTIRYPRYAWARPYQDSLLGAYRLLAPAF
ncbi:MAG: hypothetical protein ACRDOI_47010 [Trebonia sp.]